MDTLHRQAYGTLVEIDITPEQSDLVELAVKTDCLDGPSQAAREAMVLWVDRKRWRIDLLASLDLAETSLKQGSCIPVTSDEMHNLARFVIERSQARLGRNPGHSS